MVLFVKNEGTEHYTILPVETSENWSPVWAEVLTRLTSTKCPNDFLKGYNSNRGEWEKGLGLKLTVFL